MRMPSKNEAQEDSQSIPRGGGSGGISGQPLRINGSPEGVAERSVTASRLSQREIAVQISTQKETESPLPEILLNLEMDGFSLISASTFESFGDSRVFYNLHVQALSVLSISSFCPIDHHRVSFFPLKRDFYTPQISSICASKKG